LKNGLPLAIAEGYRDLYHALNDGNYQDGFERNEQTTTPTSLQWFAENEFGQAYGAAQ